MCLYHPLDYDYSYSTWFKSTLRSLVNYARHRESIYFPIYTKVFFSVSLFYNVTWELNAAFHLLAFSKSPLFCFFPALRDEH